MVSEQAPASAVQPPRRSTSALLFMLLSLVVYLVADLGTKEWALDHLSRERAAEPPPVCVPDASGYARTQRIAIEPRPLIDGVLMAHYAENCGAAFSMLRTAPGWLRLGLFGMAAVGACIALTIMFVRGVGGRAFVAGVPMLMSGAIGNVSDRVRHGFVVDFIQVDPQLFNYPIFNVADIALAVGVGLLLLEGMKKGPSATSETAQQQAT